MEKDGKTKKKKKIYETIIVSFSLFFLYARIRMQMSSYVSIINRTKRRKKKNSPLTLTDASLTAKTCNVH